MFSIARVGSLVKCGKFTHCGVKGRKRPKIRQHVFLTMVDPMSSDEALLFDAQKIERPDPSLFHYYIFVSLLSGPLTPIVLLPLYFRYITLRYKFDDSGVSMRWGILFRKEVYLTYRRIQDIHLTRNILQRWMGLAKISLQTASGSSQAEMAIEGILQPELLRDFLYSKMRGAMNKGNDSATNASGSNGITGRNEAPMATGDRDRATQALVEIKQALQKLVDQKQSQAEGDAQ